MSLAIHVFVLEKFSEESYRRFLAEAENLFGNWKLEETTAFIQNPRKLTVHECWIKSEERPANESFRVNLEVSRHLKDVPAWDFDYEWHLRIETGAGRSPLGIAVQFGIWLLAMRRFRFNIALDRDSGLENEAAEFRSVDAAVEHVHRFLKQNPLEWRADLKRCGIVDDRGYLLLP